MSKILPVLLLFGFLAVLSMAACGLLLSGIPSKGFVGISSTAVARTVAAQQTEVAAQATSTAPPIPDTPTLPAPSPTNSPTAPAATLTPAPSPTATSEPVPCNRAKFVEDVTVPDGTTYAPGEKFTKTWRLKNTGGCSWNQDYDLVFSGGVLMSASTSIGFPKIVKPGESVDLSAELVAPEAQGEYRGEWLLRDPAGWIFGLGKDARTPFWVEIEVSTAGRRYTNTELGYSLVYPYDWTLDDHGLSQPNKEIILAPPNAEPFIAYFSVLVDPRTMDEIQDFYAESVPDADKSQTTLAGRTGTQYTYSFGRIEIYLPYRNRVFLFSTDKPNNPDVKNILDSFTFV